LHDEPVLYIAFVWNQHQPFYKDYSRNRLIMPWVRLHAAKDYYQMAAILEQYPEIRQTFNLTPSLLAQLQDYTGAGVEDYYLAVMKPPVELTVPERLFLLQHYFDIHWERVIARFPRYRELLEKQGYHREPGLNEDVLDLFAERDYRDLQVWFNLAWFDPEIRDGDPFLNRLVSGGRDFSEEEKEQLLEKQMEILSRTIPIHRSMKDRGHIELMTTPFYHPIMPLIIDSSSVCRNNPGINVPGRYCYPEDIRAQMQESLKQYRVLFGGRPAGLWPSEQAVSPEIIPLCSELGFSWAISDEQILARSLGVDIQRDHYGHVLNPEILYQPYLIGSGEEKMIMIFRDHNLSDRIGFEYQHFSGEDAAADLVHRLHCIRNSLVNTREHYLVTISLDGENAWEWYADDKREFLHALYRRLSSERFLRCVTVSEYISRNPPRAAIGNLYTGSWVDHGLTRWIGSDNKNAMWDLLLAARKAVDDCRERFTGDDRKKIGEALHWIYIAEGSDYYWWVDSMPYYLAAPFEALFRKHLANVYHALGLRPPAALSVSVIRPEPGEPAWEHDPIAGPVSMVDTREENREES